MLRSIDSIAKDSKIIKDSKMEPYFLIKMSQGGYAVATKVVKENNKRDYVRIDSYPSTFSSAIKMVAKKLLEDSPKKEYSSIREYLDEWEAIKQKMETLVETYE